MYIHGGESAAACVCVCVAVSMYVADDAISCVWSCGMMCCTVRMACAMCSSGDVCYHMYWRGEQLVAVIACVAVVMPRAVCLYVVLCMCGREHQREQQQVVVVRCVS